jgi:hypothetical protein
VKGVRHAVPADHDEWLLHASAFARCAVADKSRFTVGIQKNSPEPRSEVLARASFFIVSNQ